MNLLRKWLGRPSPVEPVSTDDVAEFASDYVAMVMLVFYDGKREIRAVYKVGEMYYLWTHDLADSAKRVLPHGRLERQGPSFVTAWEPVSPIDWQPDGAETSHERIARLEGQNALLSERVASHERLLKVIVEAAKDASRAPSMKVSGR